MVSSSGSQFVGLVRVEDAQSNHLLGPWLIVGEVSCRLQAATFAKRDPNTAVGNVNSLYLELNRITTLHDLLLNFQGSQMTD